MTTADSLYEQAVAADALSTFMEELSLAFDTHVSDSIRASSMVERAAVNRKVLGSSPRPEDLNHERIATRSTRPESLSSETPWRPKLR